MKQALDDLKAMGLKEIEIARRLRAMGRPVAQSTINRLVHADRPNPTLRTARNLCDLRDRLLTQRAAGVADRTPA